jgi:hypothetical protein
MRFKAVSLGEDRSNAALGIPRIAVGNDALADKRDGAGLGRFEGGTQARDAGTNDQAIGKPLFGRDSVYGH